MIIIADLIIILIIISFIVMFILYCSNMGVPIYLAVPLGIVGTYIFIAIICILLHTVFRKIVGKNRGNLPAWKVFFWGLMAALHYMLFFVLKIVLPRQYLPNWLLRAFGMHIGSGTVNMGYVLDPEMITLGENVFIGDNVILSGHVMSRANRSVYRAPVIIEDNVIIGKDCVITPGVNIAKGVKILPNTLVSTNKHLSAGKTYGGTPASEIIDYQS